MSNQGHVAPPGQQYFPSIQTQVHGALKCINRELQITVLRKPELQENPERQVNAITKTIYEQKEKISKEREIIKKEPERGSGAEGLREGNAKCTEGTTSRTDHTEEGSAS